MQQRRIHVANLERHLSKFGEATTVDFGAVLMCVTLRDFQKEKLHVQETESAIVLRWRLSQLEVVSRRYI